MANYELERYITSIKSWEYVVSLGSDEPTALAEKVKVSRTHPTEKYRIVKVTRQVLKNDYGN